jgi:hypothetical protein
MKPFLSKCPCCKTGNLHRIALLTILAVAKVQVTVKAKLRVRVLLLKCEGKHSKTKAKSFQKKRILNHQNIT